MALAAKFSLVFAAFVLASLLLAGCVQAPPQGGGAAQGGAAASVAAPTAMPSAGGGVQATVVAGGVDEFGDFVLPDGSDAQGGSEIYGSEMDSFG